MMKLLSFTVALVLALAPMRADAFSIEKIADCDTSIPGLDNVCPSPYAPVIDAGVLAFAANGGQAVVRYQNGALELVANQSTPLPSSGQPCVFCSFGAVSTSAGAVSFGASYGVYGYSGVYSDTSGSLQVVADAPGSRTFAAGTSGTNVLFGYANGVALYLNEAGTDRLIADNLAAVPGGSGAFNDIPEAAVDGRDVVFRATACDSSGCSQHGLYTNIGGVLDVLVDQNTPVPGPPAPPGSQRFPTWVTISQGSVAFATCLTTGSGCAGVYVSTGGVLETIADTGTAAPGALGNFNYLSQPSIDHGAVVFLGYGAQPAGGFQGIYTTFGGTLTKVVDSTDADFLGAGFNLGGRAISGNQIVFVAYPPGYPPNLAIYLATLTDFCGNRVVDPGEQCDDGNADDTDACLNTCQSATCGDGFVYAGVDQCDDGNAASGDGCSDICQDEFCGDSVPQAGLGETCDDGNLVSGDGCDANCQPSLCANISGDRDIIVKPNLSLKRINTDTTPDNDSLSLKGEFVSATSFASLDPVLSGARLVIGAQDGTTRVDVAIPAGPYDGTSGWRVNSAGTQFQYIDKTKPPTNNGITKIKIQDLSTKAPNQVRIQVKGKFGTYPVVPGDEPVKAIVVIGNGAIGECGETAFGVGNCQFNGSGNSLKCTE